MYRGLLFIIAIYSATCFNIKISPVKHFKNGDPLFGQSIIQSTDGVFVPSPKLGKLFKCTAENECVEVKSDDVKPKGLRPVASLSSLTLEEEQHVMMCNQIRVRESSSEDLNGECKLMYSTGTVIKKMNPVTLVNNNNNNNNHYQGRWIGQDQRRMRRDAQSESDTKDKDEDYDDAGRETAFVLDGSGSIDHDDFQRAKDFIYNVMSNVWKTCFNCDFAIVQFGAEIRTELSLLDSKDHAKALLKVKEIQQLGKITKTASAIHHVLTDIFIPENGSKKNSKKSIIVMSDGKMLGDPMNLSDVLNMPQMKGVTRYSIGVGSGILDKPEAIEEMTQIADPEKFYKVSNYAALDDIQSSLEQSLTGAQDAGREIAFVLDGSGSIEQEDFQRAKDFIHNVMSNVWKTCFNCDFAIVQFGAEIRTELSLLDSKDHVRALLKVKDIQQLGKITKTASAIHHVLTDIFIPENGSKNNSKKSIIVLSDGKMAGDSMSLTDVLNMPQMKGVTRYSIGVGSGILDKPEAIEEMTQIADPEKFYKVSNYAELDDIQSSLEQSLTGAKDAGTEIAFVLDGSGSIDHDDFQRAKDFMHDVMFKVWNTCFDCNFAIVQFGQEVRTELSLLDNEESAKALQKVKDIQQLGKITKTASAIHHVLTDIFIPENGSKNNSRKIMIVLSDGKMSGDSMNLTDVLNMPQMKGVTRYSIGVGSGILDKPEAIEEMTQIADPDKFYKVSNYAALNDILSSLQQNLTGIEDSQQGAGFQFQLAEAGFSSHLMQDNSILFGAVGAFGWSGAVILQSGKTVTLFNDSNDGPKFSYLGYSVASAKLNPSKTLYISGAPRYNLTGGVFIFSGSEKYVLQGDQVGSYFGSVLCALDIDRNQYTDYLLVGAPHFHQSGEEGKVLMYRLNQEDRFESVAMELKGEQTFARFGAAIASIGDIDGNKFNDIAVGAPLESDSAGSIYIYNGFKDGLTFSQKISPSDFGIKLVHFGQSVSSAPDRESNKASITVGSQGGVLVFETIPVIVIKPSITITPSIIKIDQQMSDLSINYHTCFNVMNEKLKIKLPIKYKIDLDSDVNKKRLTYEGKDLLEKSFTLTPDVECTSINLKYSVCFDCFSPIKIKLTFSLDQNKEAPIRILDKFSPQEVVHEISFEKECKTADCKPSIVLSDSKISEDLIIIGETQSLNINFNLTNTEDPSYMTTLTLTFPSILSQRKIEGATCPVKNENQIQCNIQHPIFKRGAQTTLFISWQLSETKSDLKKYEITANLSSQNLGSEILATKTYPFEVMYSLPIQLSGKASTNRLRIEEGQKVKIQEMNFEFQFAGENKYGATIKVVVNITKDTFKTDLDITNVTPQEECVLPKNTKVEGLYMITCSLTTLKKIIIDAKVLIHDVQESTEKITAVATYSFDESIYTAKHFSRTFPVEVIVAKLQVTKSIGPIIGGSIGGFLLLFIIIIILIKCGFFRRRHKMDQAQSAN
ncbi:integrin alpha-E isoform X5 [Carassius gibelio]|uniref:integrin alpha-E isoform X5 n=1 Tax=Carassius gibelio TaxID=101364 RepID=UPI002278BCC9|nr:integrin alpha-E isoform X5 [Carassius gibelio]